MSYRLRDLIRIFSPASEPSPKAEAPMPAMDAAASLEQSRQQLSLMQSEVRSVAYGDYINHAAMAHLDTMRAALDRMQAQIFESMALPRFILTASQPPPEMRSAVEEFKTSFAPVRAVTHDYHLHEYQEAVSAMYGESHVSRARHLQQLMEAGTITREQARALLGLRDDEELKDTVPEQLHIAAGPERERFAPGRRIILDD